MSHPKQEQNATPRSKLIFRLVGISIIAICLILYIFINQPDLGMGERIRDIIEKILLSLFSSTITVLAIDLFVSNSNASDMKKNIGAIFEQKLSESGINHTGITNVHDGLPRTLLNQRIESSNDLFILQTYIASIDNIHIALSRHLRSGKQVRVLLLDPRSPAVEIRSAELHASSPSSFRQKILDNMTLLREISEDGVDIRIQSRTPSISIYGNSENMLVGHFLFKMLAVQGPILDVQKGYYFNILLEYYNRLWENADILTDELYKKFLNDYR